MSYLAKTADQYAIVKNIAKREMITGFLWLALGIGLFSVMATQHIDEPMDQGPPPIPFIVCCLDFAEGITRLRRVKRLRLRDATVLNTRMYRFVTVIALIVGNLAYGYVGIILVALNFANAKRIKANADLFDVKLLKSSTLKKCPACEAEVGAKATTCPNCQAVGI